MQPNSRTSPREIKNCDVCGNSALVPFLDLGWQPLPDDLLKVGSHKSQRHWPIEVLYCDCCRTGLQRWRAPQELLFHPEYHYRASQTKDVLDGMKQFADAVERHQAVAGKKVLDIGCNDGSLLDEFRGRGASTYGVEPTNAAQIANAKGHQIMQGFFDTIMAEAVGKIYGTPDIITFTNVFAHIADLEEAISALRLLIGRDTIVIIENHYLGSVLEKHQFDTFYLEHPRTYSYTAFDHIAARLRGHIEWADFPARYGGNIRVAIYPGLKTPYPKYLRMERDFLPYVERFNAEVHQWGQKRLLELEQLVRDQGKISALAFPARAAILINYLGLSEDEIFAVYEKTGSPKIGHYVPGTRIPIQDDAFFFPAYARPEQYADLWRRCADDTLLNLAWHIPKEIEARWRDMGFGGKIMNIVEAGDFDEPLKCTWP